MKMINETAVPIEHRRSPGGAFEVFRQHISLSLGGIKDTGGWGGGHPFDVELATIPAGKKNYPFHSHAAQTEYYIVCSGAGLFVDGTGASQPIKTGDHLVVLPGEAHQIMNNSESDLCYFVIADHHRADVTTYPKTGKRMIKPEMRCVQMKDCEYYEGEE